MAVKWSEILKSQILENDRFAVAADQKTDPGLDRNYEFSDRLSDERNMKKESFDFSLGTDVSGRRTKIGKRLGKAADVLVDRHFVII